MALFLVCGSRDYENYDAILAYLEQRVNASTDVVMHGGARGADLLCGEACDNLGLHVAEVRALWEIHNRGAGYMRNKVMIGCRPIEVAAFFHDLEKKSKGTLSTCKLAKANDIPLLEFDEEGNYYDG